MTSREKALRGAEERSLYIPKVLLDIAVEAAATAADHQTSTPR